ncbi:hypothetical protein ACQR3P_22885 [Rhodococcus sp. IEGM1300]
MMIELYELRYALSAFTIMALIVFIGFVPWAISYRRKTGSSFGLIEASSFAVVASVIFLAVVGFIVSLLPSHLRHVISLSAIIAPLLLGAFKTLLLLRNPDLAKPSPNSFVIIGGFLFFGIAILILTSFKYPLKENLPDGAYVNKEHVLPVKIQSITGNLPADNVVPFVVEEYLAKDISFKENSPILPGQHVANRPILVSLVTLPIRSALRSPKSMEHLPTYEYVSTQWPDFRVLLRDEAAFSIFLGVGVFLNACLFLGIGLMSTQIENFSRRSSALLLLLFASSPYFIFQTMFTWPKSLAGFFIITSIFTFQKYKNGVLTGVLLALAYLSHPYAVGYLIVASSIFLIFKSPEGFFKKLSNIFAIGLSFSLFVSPWFIWIKYYVGGSSDLISQNFSSAHVSPFQFVWPRVANLMNATLPTHLLSFETHFTSIYTASSLNLAGAVGTLFFAVSIMMAGSALISTNVKKYNFFCWNEPYHLKQALLICGGSSLLLACVFSYPAVSLVHGWQPFAALVILCGVHFASTSKLALIVCWLQVIVNILMTAIYFYRRFLITD